MTTAADFYADPLVYDILHAKGTAAEVDALQRLAARFAPAALRPGATWLEPACGSARHLRLLAKRGQRVLGFDAQPAMVAFASRHLPRRIFQARLDTFLDTRPSLRADFAFNLINTIRHARSDAEMLRHFKMTARALRPGAAYVVGLSLSLYGSESPTEDVWSGTRGNLSVTQVVQFLPPDGEAAGRTTKGRDELVISHLTIRQGAATRDVDSTYALRTYSLAQWTRLIERSPFRLVGIADQDGHAIEPQSLGYQLFVLAPRSSASKS